MLLKRQANLNWKVLTAFVLNRPVRNSDRQMSNGTAKNNLFKFMIFGIFAITFFTSFASAETISNFTQTSATAPLNNFLLNFTVSSNATMANLTEVNVTIPANIVYISSSNNTSGFLPSFASVSDSVAWTNATSNGLFGPSGNGTLWFAFNVSASKAGGFQFTVTTKHNITTISNTSTNGLQVNKAILNLSISGSGVTYPSSTSISTTESNAGDIDVNYSLYRNTSNAPVNFSTTNGTAPNGETILLGAGAYLYIFNATGGDNYTINSTGVSLTVTVSQGTPVVNVFINNLTSNQSVTYPNTIEMRGNTTTSVNPPTFNLYAGTGTLLATGSQAVSTQLLGAATYVIFYNTSGNSNWTSASNSSFNLTVNQGTPDVRIYINNITGNQSATYPNFLEVRGNTSSSGVLPSFTLHAGNLQIATGSQSVFNDRLGAGTHFIIYNTSGNVNWTAASNSSLNITINQGTPVVNVFINNLTSNQSVTYPNTIEMRGNTTTSVNPPTFNLYAGTGTLLATGSQAVSTQLLGAATYVIFYNTSGNSNWTSASNSSFNLTVNQAVLQLDIFSSAASIVYGTQTTASGNQSSTGDDDVTYKLFRNESLIVSGVNSNQSEAITLAAAAYVYKFNASSGQNYTVNNTGVSLNITVNQSALLTNLLINGVEANKTTQTGEVINITATTNIAASPGIFENEVLLSSGSSPLQVTKSYLSSPSLVYLKTNATGNQNYSTNSTGITRNITLFDSLQPVGTFIGYTNDTPVKNGASISLNINITDNDNQINNCTIGLGNSSTAHEIIPSSQQLQSTSTVGAIQYTEYSCNKTVTVPLDLGADGSKIINITMRDRNVTNNKLLVTRTFKLDNTLPTGSLSLDKSSVDTGQTITPTCTGSDANTVSTSLSVTKPGGSVVTATCGLAFTMDLAGTYTFTLTVTDGAGNSVTFTASATASTRSSDGGGSGSGVQEPRQAVIFSKITPGAAEVFKITNDAMGIKEIRIEVNNEANNVRVEVKKLDGKPAEITKEVEGKVFRYVKIDVENVQDRLSRARIKFDVEKSWLSSNSVIKENIIMKRFFNGKWENLPTSITGENSDKVSYEATTSGFSVFVISVAIPVEAAKLPSGAAETAIPSVTVESTTTTIAPEAAEPSQSGLYLLLLVVGVIVAYYFYTSKK